MEELLKVEELKSILLYSNPQRGVVNRRLPIKNDGREIRMASWFDRTMGIGLKFWGESI
jgi:hypothetical protein